MYLYLYLSNICNITTLMCQSFYLYFSSIFFLQKRSFIGKDKGEPSSKKNIKCAICEDLFSHAEWDDHVANEHDLIAWKVGSRIVSIYKTKL